MHILVTIVYPIFAPVTLTLVYECSLGILKTYPPTKNEVYRLRLSKIRTQTVHTHSHRQEHTVALRVVVTEEVMKCFSLYSHTLAAL